MGVRVGGGGGQGGCEELKVLLKLIKKWGGVLGGRVGGVGLRGIRLDVNEELKFL